MLYYILNVKMTSQSLQTSQSYLPSTRASIQQFDDDCDLIFYFQNVIEHRFSWNKCWIDSIEE